MNELARKIFQRRTELGLTQQAISEVSGVAKETISNAENGMTPQPLNRRKIERALGWMSGSIDAILAGGNETLLEEVEAETHHHESDLRTEILSFGRGLVDYGRDLTAAGGHDAAAVDFARAHLAAQIGADLIWMLVGGTDADAAPAAAKPAPENLAVPKKQTQAKTYPKPSPEVTLSGLRKAAGLSIEDLLDRIHAATDANYTQEAIDDLENGRGDYDRELVAAIETAYGLPHGSVHQRTTPAVAPAVAKQEGTK